MIEHMQLYFYDDSFWIITIHCVKSKVAISMNLEKMNHFQKIFHYSNWLQGKTLKHVTYLTYWSIRIDAYHWKREIPMFYRLVSFAADVYENLVFWWYYDVSVAKMHYYKGQLSSPFRKPKYDILKVEVNKFTFV